MAAKAQFLVRDGSGKMATVVAHSVRGALQLFIHKYKPAIGDVVSVKPRGSGDWADYTITR